MLCLRQCYFVDCRGKHGSATLACRCALSALVRFSDMQVVSKRGHAKILAFGLAKLARAQIGRASCRERV